MDLPTSNSQQEDIMVVKKCGITTQAMDYPVAILSKEMNAELVAKNFTGRRICDLRDDSNSTSQRWNCGPTAGSVMKYTNWAPGEPIYISGCVFLDLDGKWTTRKQCSEDFVLCSAQEGLVPKYGDIFLSWDNNTEVNRSTPTIAQKNTTANSTTATSTTTTTSPTNTTTNSIHTVRSTNKTKSHGNPMNTWMAAVSMITASTLSASVDPTYDHDAVPSTMILVTYSMSSCTSLPIVTESVLQTLYINPFAIGVPNDEDVVGLFGGAIISVMCIIVIGVLCIIAINNWHVTSALLHKYVKIRLVNINVTTLLMYRWYMHWSNVIMLCTLFILHRSQKVHAVSNTVALVGLSLGGILPIVCHMVGPYRTYVTSITKPKTVFFAVIVLQRFVFILGSTVAATYPLEDENDCRVISIILVVLYGLTFITYALFRPLKKMKGNLYVMATSLVSCIGILVGSVLGHGSPDNPMPLIRSVVTYIFMLHNVYKVSITQWLKWKRKLDPPPTTLVDEAPNSPHNMDDATKGLEMALLYKNNAGPPKIITTIEKVPIARKSM
eukprot:PhF_6_TR40056/c0_g1_i1/m.59426